MNETVFSRITAATTKLNTFANEAASRFRDAESKLESAGVGFRFRGAMLDEESFTDAESGASRRRRRYLAYHRVGASFRICVEEEIRGGPEESPGELHLGGTTKPVLDCDRQTRIAAGDHLDSFLEGIAAAIEDAAAKLERERIAGAARKIKADTRKRAEGLATLNRTVAEMVEAASTSPVFKSAAALAEHAQIAVDAAGGQLIRDAAKAAAGLQVPDPFKLVQAIQEEAGVNAIRDAMDAANVASPINRLKLPKK